MWRLGELDAHVDAPREVHQGLGWRARVHVGVGPAHPEKQATPIFPQNFHRALTYVHHDVQRRPVCVLGVGFLQQGGPELVGMLGVDEDQTPVDGG